MRFCIASAIATQAEAVLLDAAASVTMASRFSPAELRGERLELSRRIAVKSHSIVMFYPCK